MRLGRVGLVAFTVMGCANAVSSAKRDPPAVHARAVQPKVEAVREPTDAGMATTTLTAMDQSNAPEDLRLTRELRKALMGDGQLSFGAKNVQIITRDAHMTLRGAVASVAERSIILRHAVSLAGATAVDNFLDVAAQ